MSVNRSYIFWGLVLVGAGVLALFDQVGQLDKFSSQTWMMVFAGVSLAALVAFGLSGWKQWGWLFPAGIFGGLAVIVGLDQAGVDGSAVGAPLFFGLMLPFAAAYLLDRQHNWWALIPGGVMLFLALATLLGDLSSDEWIGSLFLFMLAGSFLIVYLRDHKKLWALITAYVIGVVGLAPLMSIGGRDDAWFGPVLLFAIGLPFLYLYFRSPERWWAIIPGGFLILVAVVAALDVTNSIRTEMQGALTGAFVLGGGAAIFAVIWQRHHRDWARIVTLILALLAVAALFTGRYSEIFLPIAVILAGGYLLYTALRPRKV